MQLDFYKYEGTGNDFVIIDNRELTFQKNDETLIQSICDRKKGVGADGLILLENHDELDFSTDYDLIHTPRKNSSSKSSCFMFMLQDAIPQTSTNKDSILQVQSCSIFEFPLVYADQLLIGFNEIRPRSNR